MAQDPIDDLPEDATTRSNEPLNTEDLDAVVGGTLAPKAKLTETGGWPLYVTDD
jgi:hypothetical protein